MSYIGIGAQSFRSRRDPQQDGGLPPVPRPDQECRWNCNTISWQSSGQRFLDLGLAFVDDKQWLRRNVVYGLLSAPGPAVFKMTDDVLQYTRTRALHAGVHMFLNKLLAPPVRRQQLGLPQWLDRCRERHHTQRCHTARTTHHNLSEHRRLPSCGYNIGHSYSG
jgi:hypothetical protein